MEALIPFQGFYCTGHEEILEDAVSSVCRGDDWELLPVAQEVQDAIPWRVLHSRYAHWYVEQLVWMCPALQGLTLTSIRSPREYNFVNDQLIGEIPEPVVRQLFEDVDRGELQKVLRRNFTSCDGFISFYHNSLEDWPEDVGQWDAVQVGALLEATLLQHVDPDDLRPWEMAEDARSNSVFDEMVWDLIPDDLRNKLLAQLRGEQEREVSYG